MNTIEQIRKNPNQPPHVLLLAEDMCFCAAAPLRCPPPFGCRPHGLHIYGRKNQEFGECECLASFSGDAKHSEILRSAPCALRNVLLDSDSQFPAALKLAFRAPFANYWCAMVDMSKGKPRLQQNAEPSADAMRARARFSLLIRNGEPQWWVEKVGPGPCGPGRLGRGSGGKSGRIARTERDVRVALWTCGFCRLNRYSE